MSTKKALGKNPDKKVGKLKRYKARDIAWVNFGDYVTGEGAKKAVETMKELEGDAYLKHFSGMLEFFKPRLTRVDSRTEQEVVINIKTENSLPEKKDKEIVEAEVSTEKLPADSLTEK